MLDEPVVRELREEEAPAVSKAWEVARAQREQEEELVRGKGDSSANGEGWSCARLNSRRAAGVGGGGGGLAAIVGGAALGLGGAAGGGRGGATGGLVGGATDGLPGGATGGRAGGAAGLGREGAEEPAGVPGAAPAE